MIYPWLQTQWQQLVKQYQQKRLPHALLIEGSSGLGKLCLAESLAALILCERTGEAPCGVCRACVLWSAGNHPDYFKLQPEEEAKTVKIEAVRELITQLAQHAHRGGYQVAVLQPADKLNRAAMNALLKTLEEPVGQVLIILVSDQSAALPATILSRCQRILCRGSDTSETKLWLQRNLMHSTHCVEELLQAADYAPLKALELEKMNYLALCDQMVYQLLALKNQELSVVKLSSEWLKYDGALILTVLQLIALAMIRKNLGVEVNNQLHQDNANLSALYTKLNLSEWLNFLSLLQKTKALFLSVNNLNGQMLLENLLLNF